VISKSIEQVDYDHIRDGLDDAYYAYAWMLGHGHPVAIPHEHRYWEYGSALQAWRDNGHFHTAIDVGCGFSLLGPALRLQHAASVYDVDPDENVAKFRPALAAALTPDYTFTRSTLVDTPEHQYDAVYCISVLEHMTGEEQEAAWRKLARMVAPGGLLFTTLDIGDVSTREWANDERRSSKFTPDDLPRSANYLTQEGLQYEPMDRTYHG